MQSIQETESNIKIFKPYNTLFQSSLPLIKINEIFYSIKFKPSIIISNDSYLSEESETLSNSENHSINDKKMTLLNQKRTRKSKQIKNKCYKCKIEDCESLFENMNELNEHYIKNHQKIFICPYEKCKISFMSEKNLNKHIKTHNNIIKKYICPFPGCNKRFTASYNQKIHYRIHTGERPYKCEKCNNEYYDRANLKYHLRTAHQNLNCKDTICSHINCGHEFKTKKQKIMHHDKLENECRMEKNYLIRLLNNFKDCIGKICNLNDIVNYKEMKDVEKQLKITVNSVNDEEQFNAIFVDKNLKVY